ncbi:MAG: efflux RND transporter periplasmic adaptor subunit [Clostridiaceae bacterium]|nr:efflux RND transporter periplasmic adaptor subunit [Clostridiaceae bacterium]
MKKRVKIIAGAVLLGVLAVAGLVVLLMPVRVEKETVQKADLLDTFTVSATVTPKDSQYVCAPLSGTVSEVAAKEGETVEQGAKIVVLDDSQARDELNRQIESLKAQKTSAQSEGSSTKAQLSVSRQQLESQLEQAQLTYQQLYGEEGHAEQLYRVASENFDTANVAYWKAFDEYDGSKDPAKQSVLSSLESARAAAEQALVEADNNRSESTKAYYESLIASYESQLSLLDGSVKAVNTGTSASVQQIDLQMQQVQEELNKTAPTSPTDGVVWEILVKNGDYVTQNQPLYRIYNTDQMTLEADVLDTQAALLKEGDIATAKLADGSELTGTVSFLSPVSTQELSVLGIEENRSKVILDVDGLSEKMGAGHQADLTFSVVRKEDVLQIPSSAIVPGDNGDAVYVKAGGKAVLKEVELGEQSGGRSEVISGLEEGDQVVTNPYDTGIKKGTHIK